GTPYAFFTGVSIFDGNNPILKFGTYWWQRSCQPTRTDSFAICGPGGESNYGTGGRAQHEFGVVPAFCL
ncbi:MAG: hypothetical protein RR655_08425, partial [Raoultibacter sp.]